MNQDDLKKEGTRKIVADEDWLEKEDIVEIDEDGNVVNATDIRKKNTILRDPRGEY